MTKQSTKLFFGPYKTPRFKYGAAVQDASRGEVRIVGLSTAPIPWPIGQTHTAKALVLYKDLARAIRKESSIAIQHWWGIGEQSVSRWRKALGVPRYNVGTIRLQQANGHEPYMEKVRKKGQTPAARRKRAFGIAASKVGKARPPHVLAKLLQARRKPPTEENLRKIRAANRRRRLHPQIPQPWAEWEDALLKLPMREIIRRTGRTQYAIVRRRRLQFPR